ncbi:NADPH:quinone oxidoreductase [Pseudonocardia sulfidoxydans NBRC 16205]|uniref:NADPH:quinone oxidoreductase n=1 Tax=Pseudonocardia sulfidoxydans NBRC 16205 TaxID=1223511 RepID=A0A511DH72_9PSEU|nr:NADPH:quinone oxidoreductase family protein [Pseudonocardia sulfidoxydans]GEL23723.1 NADPH:quinone oxidoreductase [Pseudonocardia sulfidoxydans NBRC 16205]
MQNEIRSLQVVDLIGPDGLRLRAAPRPGPGDGDVVVDVRAAGVTFPDLLLTRGLYQQRPDLPFAPGLEVAGVVATAAADSGFAAGDRVIAYTGTGGYAEAVAVPAHHVVPLSPDTDFVVGVTLMVNYQTAYFCLVERGRLSAGETIVVHGAGGGVGTAAIQVALGVGARVIAVVSDDAKEEVARRAGATEVLRTSSWQSEIGELTDGGPAVVYDPVGGARFEESVRVLRPGGRILVIGFASGSIPQIAGNRLLLRNIEVVGGAWGHFIPHDPGMPRRVGAALDTMLASGVVRPLVEAVYPLADGAAALRDMEARRTRGKSVLVVG